MISLIYWIMQIGILTFATPGKQRTILKPSPTESPTQLYPLVLTLYNRIPNTTVSSPPNSLQQNPQHNSILSPQLSTTLQLSPHKNSINMLQFFQALLIFQSQSKYTIKL